MTDDKWWGQDHMTMAMWPKNMTETLCTITSDIIVQFKWSMAKYFSDRHSVIDG